MSTLREDLAALVAEWDAGADAWGACSHEWVRLTALRDLLARHPEPESEPCGEFGEHPRGGHADAVRAAAQPAPDIGGTS